MSDPLSEGKYTTETNDENHNLARQEPEDANTAGSNGSTIVMPEELS